MVIIEVDTLRPVAILIVFRNINPHAKWLSHYIRPVAILIQSLKL